MRATTGTCPSLDGLYNSINTITFASAAQLDFCGIQKIVDAVGLHRTARRDKAEIRSQPEINMHHWATCWAPPQTAPLTMANAFATFANDGKYCEPIAIAEVTDADRRKAPGPGHQLPRRRQAGSCPRRELRAPGSPEPGLRFA